MTTVVPTRQLPWCPLYSKRRPRWTTIRCLFMRGYSPGATSRIWGALPLMKAFGRGDLRAVKVGKRTLTDVAAIYLLAHVLKVTAAAAARAESTLAAVRLASRSASGWLWVGRSPGPSREHGRGRSRGNCQVPSSAPCRRSGRQQPILAAGQGSVMPLRGCPLLGSTGASGAVPCVRRRRCWRLWPVRTRAGGVRRRAGPDHAR
jgi:hypothetical protein